MYRRARAIVVWCVLSVHSLSGVADEAAVPAESPPPQLELSITLSENPVAVGSLVACRVVVANYGGAALNPMRLRLTASPLLRPIGGRGATPVRVRDDAVVIDALPALDTREYAEWYIVFGTEQSGGSNIVASVTANVDAGTRVLEAQATVEATGFVPGIDVDAAEMRFERARELLNGDAPETGIELMRIAVTQFDDPMFKASAYFLMSDALRRLGRGSDAQHAAEIARVLVTHAWAPASRWVPDLVRDVLRAADEHADGLRRVAPIAASSAITGRVYAGHERVPLAGAVVSLDGVADGVVSTDEQGYFILSGMALDRYTITVSKPGYLTRTRGNIDVRDFTTLRIDFRLVADIGELASDVAAVHRDDGGAVIGSVKESGAGTPLGDVSVFLEGPQRALVRTDSEGRFMVSGITPGSYIATWSKPGYFRVTRFNVNVLADEPTALQAELAPQVTTVAAPQAMR